MCTTCARPCTRWHGCRRSCDPLPLAEHGLELINSPATFAHPLDDGSAAVAERSVDATAENLGLDGDAYRSLFGSLADHFDTLSPDLLAPPRFPRHPLLVAKFGMVGLQSAQFLADHRFKTDRARALFAGAAAHSILPLDWSATSAFGLVLMAAAHAQGWPIARGGSQALVSALVSIFQSFGGTLELNAPVRSLDELPSSKVTLCDLTPQQLLQLAGERFPAGYRKSLQKYRYGPGCFKMDFALSGPIPWTAAECGRAATVHLGGRFEEVAESESAVWENRQSNRPFVLLVQPTLFDPSRAPAGKHIAWAYCHVPHGSTADCSVIIENQIERFAPGFRDLIIAKHVMNTADMERYNPNLVGGDINGGAAFLTQLFTRPVARWNPYSTPVRGLYICSASTPPGGGVHGQCGFHAATSALKSRELA